MVKPTLIVYHKNCIDGKLAFSVAAKYMKENGVDFVGYASYPAEPIADNFLYGDIYYLDLCPTPSQYKELALHHKVVVLDHHETNMESFGATFDKIGAKVTFEVECCGCVLAWKHFFSIDIPILLIYAQDYDLWEFKLGERTNEINLALRNIRDKQWENVIFPMLVGASTLETFVGNEIDKLATAGNNLKIFRDKQVDIICKGAKILVDDCGKKFAVVYTRIFKNMVAKKLYETTEAEYAVVLTGDGKVSFRSNGYDVGKIAQVFGGGGHKTSAGVKNARLFNYYMDLLKE